MSWIFFFDFSSYESGSFSLSSFECSVWMNSEMLFLFEAFEFIVSSQSWIERCDNVFQKPPNSPPPPPLLLRLSPPWNKIHHKSSPSYAYHLQGISSPRVQYTRDFIPISSNSSKILTHLFLPPKRKLNLQAFFFFEKLNKAYF